MAKLAGAIGVGRNTNCAFCDIDHFLGCTMRTICEGEGRFGQFLPGPNEAHDYEPQAYSHPGVSFDGHGVYWLVRQIEKISGAPPAGVHGGQ